MFNEEFDFYPPEHQRNMRFEKPIHGPPGRGPPGHHMRPPGPMRRRMPDMPPNFRGPREPLYDDFNPHGMPPMGMGGPRGPPGPHFGGNSQQQHMNQHNFAAPPRNQHPRPGMPPPGNGPFQKTQGPPMIPYPPPGFAGGGGASNRPPQHAQQNPQMQQNSAASASNVNLDFWVETTLADSGKTYYYHAKTRESSWIKPPNVKIISQEEIEKMAAAASDSASNEKNNTPNQFANPFVPMGPMACPMPAPGMGMLTPPAFGILGPPPPFAIPPPGLMYPYGMPPPNFGPVPQINSVAPETHTSVATTATSDTKDDEDKEWDEYTASDGKSYYVHKITKETVWEKPEKKNVETNENANASNPDLAAKPETDSSTSVMDVDEAAESQSDSQKEPPTSEKTQEDTPEKMSEMENGTHNTEYALEEKTEEKENMDSDQASPHTPVKMDNQEEKETVKKEENAPSNETKKEPIDKSRPVSSTPIPRTQWFVVWTGDGRVFFYSHLTRTSFWQRPEELKGRADVDKLLQEPPSLSSPPADSAKRGQETGSDDQKSENDSGPETKKIKREDAPEDVKAPVKTFITHGKESAIEAELRAAKERAVIALDVRMKEFIDLLIEKDVSAFSTWEKELHKIVFDPRYLLLTSKERKSCFERYVRDRAEEERSEKRKKAKEKKDDYRKLLEEASLTAKSTFSDFAQRYAKDPKFRGIAKLRERETLFNDFVETLRRKERDERSSLREKVKKDFLALLKEKQELLEKNKRWTDVKKSLSDDHRYKAVDSSSLREEWFKEYMQLSHDGEDDAVKEREKQERVEASIREREKEVERTLSTHLRERDKERELHKHDEAVQHFKALLTDLVRSPDVSWHELKRILRKDHRSDIMGCLTREERERVFDEHISFLYRKKKEKFRELLEETPEITLTSTWKEVKKLIKDDPRCSKFSSSDRKCEKEFKEYLKDKMVAAKADFRELLKETKIITYKSRKLMDETDHLNDIEKVLQNDKRYLVLQCIEEERRTLLMSYIETLDRKGPPPPPTASEPSRRSTK